MGKIFARHTPEEEERFRLTADPRHQIKVPDESVLGYFASPQVVQDAVMNSKIAEANMEETTVRLAH